MPVQVTGDDVLAAAQQLLNERTAENLQLRAVCEAQERTISELEQELSRLRKADDGLIEIATLNGEEAVANAR